MLGGHCLAKAIGRRPSSFSRWVERVRTAVWNATTFLRSRTEGQRSTLIVSKASIEHQANPLVTPNRSKSDGDEFFRAILADTTKMKNATVTNMCFAMA